LDFFARSCPVRKDSSFVVPATEKESRFSNGARGKTGKKIMSCHLRFEGSSFRAERFILRSSPATENGSGVEKSLDPALYFALNNRASDFA